MQSVDLMAKTGTVRMMLINIILAEVVAAAVAFLLYSPLHTQFGAESGAAGSLPTFPNSRPVVVKSQAGLGTYRPGIIAGPSYGPGFCLLGEHKIKHFYKIVLSVSDRRERTVPSVLNGQSLLFYHYRF